MVLIVVALALLPACEPSPTTDAPALTALEEYVAGGDEGFSYEAAGVFEREGYTVHTLRMVSQEWLTTAEVADPTWWHWVTIVVPDSVETSIGMLFIGGGTRESEQPTDANDLAREIALATGSIVANLHNVPNQPIEFLGDTFGPRVEDELIAYAWRQYLEGGADEDDARWLPRLPMTNAAVRAMDAVSAYSAETKGQVVDRFVVAGSSKRGWTTWTTAAVDERVVAIVPVVIDLLNVVPSFEHHWRAYGHWAPAIGDYEREGIMDWQASAEYRRLMEIVEPFSYRGRLILPKLLINASGDEFFLPDSWRFYWDDLPGEKRVRYVPNAGHSLRGSDVGETITAFVESLVTGATLPTMDWNVMDGEILVTTDPNTPPSDVTLWQVANEESRDFRIDVTGEKWTSMSLPVSAGGRYRVGVEEPDRGWRAFFVELTFPGPGENPLKLTSGVVVLPEDLPHPPYVSRNARGTPLNQQ
jgi:PhoPQ-activated pathogenicity-related protein